MNITNIPIDGRIIKASISEINGGTDKGMIILLGGLLADQLNISSSSRSEIFNEATSSHGIPLIRFNFTCHGYSEETQSDGSFSDLSITRLIEDAVGVISYYKPRKMAMIGSSIGAGIMPFVASRIKLEHGIDTVGYFGVSAVPPEALKAFVFSQMNEDQKIKFSNGEPVTITSRTLPKPVEVTSKQFDDIRNYEFRINSSLLKLSGLNRLLVGKHDALGTQDVAMQLMRLLGGKNSEIRLVDAPHDIPHNVMFSELDEWLNELSISW